MRKAVCSIVMPSYNSEQTIERVLKSVRMQTISDQIEIILADGGSTDKTIELAKKYDAIVIQNPDRVPEVGKLIAIREAKGKYVVWEDTDEELLFATQLENRINFMERHNEVKCMVCDVQHPGFESGISGSYLCYCGDPFSNFVYRRRNGILDTFVSNIAYSDISGSILKFKDGDATPIGDGGTTIFDFEWIRDHFKDEWDNQAFICSITDKICRETGCCGCIPGDNIVHHARADFKTYLKKLKFRVVNNIFEPDRSGYSARTESATKTTLSKRKYLYVLYSATIILPLLDAIRIALREKDIRLLLHWVYNYYVCFEIAVNLVKKLLGKSSSNRSYG